MFGALNAVSIPAENSRGDVARGKIEQHLGGKSPAPSRLFQPQTSFESSVWKSRNRKYQIYWLADSTALNLPLAAYPCVGHIGPNGAVAEWLKAAVC